LRNIAPVDAETAAELLAQLGYPTSADMFRDKLIKLGQDASNRVLVAVEDGRVVGLVAVHTHELVHAPGLLGRITALVVHSEFRRRGLGRKLVQAAERHCVSVGCVLFEVTSSDSRLEARAFYESLGYTERRRRFTKPHAA
jgi:ribosomal protein S18 acetylase RimI-like enzyme